MVFLRLTVKIFPREQQPTSSSFSLRSILGDRTSDREDATTTGTGTASANGTKPASFLLVLSNPESITLGGLAGMIHEKWSKLRPNAEPLHIKKLLDDDHEADDLDADMTVADVFVDNGLSQVDGRDQRRTVRVIQKPAPYAPTRFPSVSLDWDAAAEDFQRQRQRQEQGKKDAVRKFSPIAEDVGAEDNHDTPLKSVERDEAQEIPGSPHAHAQVEAEVDEFDSQGNGEKAVEATPQHVDTRARRMESQELGSPTPTTRSRTTRSTSARGRPAQRTISRMAPPSSQEEEEKDNEQQKSTQQDKDGDVDMEGNKEPHSKKRKATEDLPPNKEPRLDSSTTNADRDQSPVARKPSFSRTGRRTSFTEQQSPPKPGLGLGITRSPSRKRTTLANQDLPSSEASVLAASILSSGSNPTAAPTTTAPEKTATPSKLLTPFTEKPLHSALRKPSPVDKEPRSVSFSGKKDIIPARPVEEPKSTPTPAPTQSDSQWLEKMQFPPTISTEDAKKLVQQEKQKIERETKAMREDEEKLRTARETGANVEYIRVLEDLCTARAWIANTKAGGRVKMEKRIKQEEQRVANLRKKLGRLEVKWGKVQNPDKSDKSDKSKTGKTGKQEKSKAEKEKEKEEKEKANKAGKAEKSKSEKEKSKTGKDGKEKEGKEGKSGKTDKPEKPSQSAKNEGKNGKSEKPENKASKDKTDKPEPKEKPRSKSKTKSPEAPTSAKDKSKGLESSRSEPEPAESAKSAESEPQPETINSAEHESVDPAPARPEPEPEPEPVPEPESVETAVPERPAEPEAEPESETTASKPEHEPMPEPMQVTESVEPAANPAETAENELTNGVPDGDGADQMDLSHDQAESQAEQTEPQPEPQPEPAEPAEEKNQTEIHAENQPKSQETSESDDLKLPSMPNVRSVDQTKPQSKSPSASAPAPAPASTQTTPKPKALSSEKKPEEVSTDSDSDSDSSSSDSSDDDIGITQSQPPPQTNPRFSSPWARNQTPSQSQPQSQPQPQIHTQPFQAINRTNARTSLLNLKTIMDQQKSEHDARVQQARQASHQPRKDIFDPSSDSDDDDDDSDSDSDSDSKSSADEGDIQSSGTVGKLRKAISWRGLGRS